MHGRQRQALHITCMVTYCRRDPSGKICAGAEANGKAGLLPVCGISTVAEDAHGFLANQELWCEIYSKGMQ